MFAFIVLGDTTDHGGEVLEGSYTSLIEGKPIARMGDRVSCPRCPGIHTIIEGNPQMMVDGRPAALHGSKTSCGARVRASQTDATMGGSDDADASFAEDIADAASAMEDEPAELAGYAPAQQAATASNGRPPTEAEIRQYMNAHYAKHDITTDHNPNLAINKKAIAIVREGKTVTLRARVTVSGNRAADFAVAVMSQWNKSYTDADGTIYKSDVEVIPAPSETNAIIRLKWVMLRGGREQGVPNGDILLNIEKEKQPIDRGMTAHEFGHSFFGLKDGYEETVKMPNGTVVKCAPYSGMEGSIMADDKAGVVRLQDLKALIGAYDTALH